MKNKILIAVASSILFSAFFAFLINEALIERGKDHQASFQAKSVLTAIEKAAELKSQILEKEIEDLVSVGVRQQLDGDLERALNQNLLSVYVYDQSSREALWTWEGESKTHLKEAVLAKNLANELFEGPAGWLALKNKGESYPLMVFRRLLLFPDSKTEKEVTIAALVSPQYWGEFAEGLALQQGGLALYAATGDLIATSSPEVVRLQRRLGSPQSWLKGAVHWRTSSVEPDRIRLSSRPIAGGQLWLLSFFEVGQAKESLAFFLALFCIFFAFSLIVGGLVIILMPQVVLPEIFQDLENEEDEVGEHVLAAPAITEEFKEQAVVSAPRQSGGATLRIGEEQLPRLNEQERFTLVKNIAREVSRELVRPLTSILGHVQLGREVKQGDNEHWSKIEGEARKAKKFIENLRAVAGDAPAQNSRSSVAKVLEGLIRRLHWDLEQKNVKIESEIDTQALVAGDSYALEDAFSALIMNAAEAQEGHRDKKITIKAYNEDKRCVIEIIDKGDGISEDIKTKVFEPFFSTKKDEGHHGLGLSLARAIFEAQGAEFHFDSVEGEGTHLLIKFDKLGEEQKLPTDLPSAPAETYSLDQEELFSEKRLNEELSFIGEKSAVEESSPEPEELPLPRLERKADQYTVKIRPPREKT